MYLQITECGQGTIGVAGNVVFVRCYLRLWPLLGVSSVVTYDHVFIWRDVQSKYTV